MRKKVLFSLMMLATCTQVSAEGGVAGFLKKLGTSIDSMTIRGLDQRYITMPEKPWQIILKGDINQCDVKMKATLDGKQMFGDDFGNIFWEPRIKTDLSTYVGLWAGYRGYGLGYSKNVSGKGGIFNLKLAGKSYGANLRINTFETAEPVVRLSGYLPTWEEESYSYTLVDPIKVRLLTFDAYYLFNSKRFSYSAAYGQSLIQKRSAGSLMVGFMYDHTTVRYDEGRNGDFILFMNDIGKLKHYQASLGGGYAYNLVPCKGLLISGMGMVMLTCYNRLDVWRYNSKLRQRSLEERKNLNIEDEIEEGVWDEEDYEKFLDWFAVWPMEENHKNTSYSRVTPIIDARLSVTYNFGDWFFNANAQYNNFVFKHNSNKGSITDWYVNASIGIRL